MCWLLQVPLKGAYTQFENSDSETFGYMNSIILFNYSKIAGTTAIHYFLSIIQMHSYPRS